MNTTYRDQLASKIDGITALERSGYGATSLKARKEKRESDTHLYIGIALLVGLFALFIITKHVNATLATYGL